MPRVRLAPRLVIEGDSVTVEFVAEAGTKPASSGTVAQKISTVHKVAGTTHVSDELLDDSNGMAAELIASQFAKAIGSRPTSRSSTAPARASRRGSSTPSA